MGLGVYGVNTNLKKWGVGSVWWGVGRIKQKAPRDDNYTFLPLCGCQIGRFHAK